MAERDQDVGLGNPSGKELVAGAVMFLITIAFVIALGLYVRSGFETLEEQLSYQPPNPAPSQSNGAYGIEIVEGQTVYIPVYSHIYANGGKPFLLETTLSIRNLDPNQPILIQSAKYFDTQGRLLRNYVEQPLTLAPLATTEFLVETQDISGGSGANFIVTWDAAGPTYEPLIEAVMVGFDDANSISFTSPGRALMERQ